MNIMPAIFVGHGSPTTAIDDNRFTQGFKELSIKLPKPKAILMISAHWFVSGSKIIDDPHPRTIYDMYGFPNELYEIKYDSPGSPHTAHRVQELLSKHVAVDNTWGYDHGCWSVLHLLFPKRDIPVTQLSIDRRLTLKEYLEIGKLIRTLREEGVMIIGSGNIVHNLWNVNWDYENRGFDWAERFDGFVKQRIEQGRFEELTDPHGLGQDGILACPTIDHYAPLLYVLGTVYEKENMLVFNEGCTLGGVSMTSYIFGLD